MNNFVCDIPGLAEIIKKLNKMEILLLKEKKKNKAIFNKLNKKLEKILDLCDTSSESESETETENKCVECGKEDRYLDEEGSYARANKKMCCNTIK